MLYVGEGYSLEVVFVMVFFMVVRIVLVFGKRFRYVIYKIV